MYDFFTHCKKYSTGKGLAFAKKLAEKLGEKIDIKSVEIEYSKFSFYINATITNFENCQIK
jgi:signal transduction histidine kinase